MQLLTNIVLIVQILSAVRDDRPCADPARQGRRHGRLVRQRCLGQPVRRHRQRQLPVALHRGVCRCVLRLHAGIGVRICRRQGARQRRHRARQTRCGSERTGVGDPPGAVIPGAMIPGASQPRARRTGCARLALKLATQRAAQRLRHAQFAHSQTDVRLCPRQRLRKRIALESPVVQRPVLEAFAGQSGSRDRRADVVKLVDTLS